jgi:hypothetical protein
MEFREVYFKIVLSNIPASLTSLLKCLSVLPASGHPSL